MRKSTQNIVQFVFAIALAIMLGLTLTQAVGAQKYAKGTTQASSIQNVKEMCEVSGGTLDVTNSPFEGVKISKCTGGDMDGLTCGHGQKSLNCSYQITSQPAGPIIVANSLEVVPAIESNDQVSPVQPASRAP